MKFHWSTKRIKFGMFHLYRKPLALQSSMFGLHCEPGVTWEMWHERIKKLCPIQYWFREDVTGWWYSICRRAEDIKYDIKCYFKPYNVLKINTLPRTWCDNDQLLVHSIFAVLERFMSPEAQEYNDYSTNEEDRLFWKEISEVWQWWNRRDERDAAEAAALHLCHDKKCAYAEKYKELYELEARYEKELNDAIQIILKHRLKLYS